MKAKTKELLARCIEEGAQHGYTQAHDHADQPTEDEILDAVVENILREVDTYFDFEGAPLTKLIEGVINDRE